VNVGFTVTLTVIASSKASLRLKAVTTETARSPCDPAVAMSPSITANSMSSRFRNASRGSGALPSAVDVLLEMYWHGRAFDGDRRRRILGFSRFEDTPRQLVVELNEARTDYAIEDEQDAEQGPHKWQALNTILQEAGQPLTSREILALWSEDLGRPDEATLWRWLDRAEKSGRVLQSGAGGKKEPFRYWVSTES